MVFIALFSIVGFGNKNLSLMKNSTHYPGPNQIRTFSNLSFCQITTGPLSLKPIGVCQFRHLTGKPVQDQRNPKMDKCGRKSEKF